MLARFLLWLAFCGVFLGAFGMPSYGAEGAASDAKPDPIASRAIMTGEQVVQILDETVDWYRTLGTQQQAATQPSDLLILYANRQTADKVIALAFEIARANAELISSEAGAQQERQDPDASESRSMVRIKQKLDEQRSQLQAEIESVRRQLGAATAQQRGDLRARLEVLQGELDLINAQRNLFANMAQYANENVGANALKTHIDAIAASIPSASAAPLTTPATSTTPAAATSVSAAVSTSLSQFGIWDLTATVLRLSAKARTIETVDRRTAELQEVFTQIRDAPLQQLQALAARGDALAAETRAQDQASLKRVRDQYDTIAWLFQQTSSIVTPLSKAEVLLTQYRNNLDNWREATQRQSREAWRVLVIRLAIFAALLALVFTAAEVWRRAVFRYVSDARRRSRLLLLRKIVLWALVVAIAAATFATELGSLATFAGLITAGLAVAMQSVLVSVVGYFFLIGKYGIRVGDRIQIGSVTGEVIDLGLVRVHLMELSGQGGAMSPTGRVVAFANSVIFQASGGLFKQIPGIDLAWHEITVRLPLSADHAALKTRLIEAVSSALNDYRDDILRQTQEIQRAGSSHGAGDAQPQVQLRFSAEGVDAVVRYPVERQHAAEIDERVSREVLNVISAEPATAPAA
ncbi:mechanosensitive ion channel [Steroidobacter sp. S1-65]|uniref:Mechanosensitive ion channel n=1 Tax=Steroidobacter gossypii TaxID=2805490 RepID=A0ABS1WWJ5_9GAMM|nr:mechanosensitive ion channel family protein [Steroidobacter gossypii]MBM0105354.1 mechanosensitive ion channel [Steroidobacter gossypii]